MMQNVNFEEFTRAIVLLGLFIAAISTLLFLITGVLFFVWLMIFGMVFTIEGTIASFFEDV